MTLASSYPAGSAPGPGDRDARRSLLAAVSSPVVVAVGFVIGTVVVGDPNDPASPHGWAGAWRVMVLWGLIEIPFALGMFWGARAARAGAPTGRRRLAVNGALFFFLTLTTLVGGLVDTFTK